VAVSSRAALTAHLDPDYGEDVAPDRVKRLALELSPAQAALVRERLAQHLRHDFGYAGSGGEFPAARFAPPDASAAQRRTAH
jgi:hypothetical protein